MRFGRETPARSSWALGLSAFASVFGLLACNGNDPIPQAVIDGLPAEEGTPSKLHRPGQPCLVCHSEYGGASPVLAIAGTIFKQDPMTGARVGAPFVKVDIRDSSGAPSRFACTNDAGNFYIEADKWAELTFPLKVQAGSLFMESIIGREGSCAACHKLPPDDVIGKGATRDSAGALIVDEGDVSADCGGVP